ncbi:MAG: hypothetical protein LIO44_04050, partial [Eubacterium sp.]|nr:hypothetical protein [Eubacterium sp.]
MDILDAEILEGFGIVPKYIRKMKYMYIIKAESGLYIIRKTDSSADRIIFCHSIKNMLKRKGLRNFDSFECSRDGCPFFEWEGANYIMTR